LYESGQSDVDRTQRERLFVKILECFENFAKHIGFRNLKLGKFQYQDVGHILENIVYLELNRRGYQIWIGKIGEFEVDFIVKNVMNKFEYYQVTWSMSDPKTAEREIRPLKSIENNYPKYIISTDVISSEIEGIEHINIVEWLLRKE